MGAFFLCVRSPGSEGVRARGIAALLAQGFNRPSHLVTDHWEIVGFPKYHGAGVQLATRDPRNFALLTGTTIFEESIGARAAERFLDEFRFAAPAWERVFGHYCAILCRDGAVRLFLDRLGIYKVYTNSSRTVFSSSFLAVCEASDELAIDSQSVYEYAFQGATYGGSTVMQNVEVIRADGSYRLEEEARFEPWTDDPPHEVQKAPFEQHVETSLHNVRRVYKAIVAGFGNKIDSGLSGGYDSRLTLGLLRDQGVTPALHVYGRKSDPDVRVGTEIARGENLALRHVDKSKFPAASPDSFPAIVERNFQALDGCPPDGIFDGGVDVQTRRDRCANGELMLNGGGGEIFRNFFYLPDRRFSLRAFLWSFYSRFDPAWCTELFSEEAYLARMGQKVSTELRVGAGRLERYQIELLYPLFRCRYWMGKNNSNNNRFGWAMTPFIDYTTVHGAVRVPMRHKQHGRLQAAMIRRLDRALAGYPSVYGHDFLTDPPLRRVVSDFMTLLRPPALRRYTYRVRYRRPQPRSRYLEERFVSRVVERGFPFLSRFFRLERVNDPGVYGRICTLEYLFGKFGPGRGDRLAGS